MDAERNMRSSDLLEELIFFESDMTKIADNARQNALWKNQFNSHEYLNKLNQLLVQHKNNLSKYCHDIEVQTGEFTNKLAG